MKSEGFNSRISANIRDSLLCGTYLAPFHKVGMDLLFLIQVKMHLVLFIFCFAIVAIGQSISTSSALMNPTQWPNFADQRICAQSVFMGPTNVAERIGCAN
jgi:hypothetical protein